MAGGGRPTGGIVGGRPARARRTYRYLHYGTTGRTSSTGSLSVCLSASFPLPHFLRLSFSAVCACLCSSAPPFLDQLSWPSIRPSLSSPAVFLLCLASSATWPCLLDTPSSLPADPPLNPTLIPSFYPHLLHLSHPLLHLALLLPGQPTRSCRTRLGGHKRRKSPLFLSLFIYLLQPSILLAQSKDIPHSVPVFSVSGAPVCLPLNLPSSASVSACLPACYLPLCLNGYD